jgi:glutamine synthetase
MLKPVFACPDPIRGGDNILVLCEVDNAKDQKPHATNTRAACAKSAKKFAKHEMIFGIEQEYTFLKLDGSPLGFPNGGYPGPQGPYYCGVGAGRVVAREIIEEHTQACMDAGLMIEGTNAEVMPGQWEFQIGAADALTVSDHLTVARWLLHRIAEDYDVVVSLAAKPEKGDWNGAGAHTNFSTKAMREDTNMKAIKAACEAIGKKVDLHVKNYGHDIESRLTGAHETAPYNKFSYGVSNRGASIRIPWQVELAGRGYAEDRRPNANCDPYTVTRLIVETVCGAAS